MLYIRRGFRLPQRSHLRTLKNCKKWKIGETLWKFGESLDKIGKQGHFEEVHFRACYFYISSVSVPCTNKTILYFILRYFYFATFFFIKHTHIITSTQKKIIAERIIIIISTEKPKANDTITFRHIKWL